MTNPDNNSISKSLDLASELYQAKQYDKAFHLYRVLAEEGITTCQTMVCYMCMEGKGTPVDLKSALFWCDKSAANNDPEGLFYLGKVYAKKGEWSEVVRYYKKAALKNYSPAIYCLARMYYLGKSVDKDINNALKLMSEASSMGHLLARREYGKMLIKGQKGVPSILKGILLLFTLPFVTFREVRKDLYTEKTRI